MTTPAHWFIEAISQCHDGESWVNRAWEISHGANSHQDGPAGNICRVVSNKADAELITAAPDLLEALNKLISAYIDNTRDYQSLFNVTYSNQWNDDVLDEDVLKAAFAAIAKATGGKGI